jgi:hypothetical protein
MEVVSKYTVRYLLVLCILSLGFLAGCESTPDENCRPEICEEQESDLQRSYNPCKVNKSLPQCE